MGNVQFEREREGEMGGKGGSSEGMVDGEGGGRIVWEGIWVFGLDLGRDGG